MNCTRNTLQTLSAKFVVALSLLAFGTTGFAESSRDFAGYKWETVYLPGNFYVYAGETRSVSVDSGRWRHVKNLYVQAESNNGAMVEVSANGDVKGSLYVPGNDPSYVVTIGETARSIEFRNTGSSRVHIQSIKAIVSYKDLVLPDPIDPIDPIAFPIKSQAGHLARRARHLVDSLRPYVDPETEYVRFLLPIKIQAGRAEAVANANGDLSAKVRRALQALVAQIAFADNYIESSLKKEVTYEMGKELLTVKDKIIDLLD